MIQLCAYVNVCSLETRPKKEEVLVGVDTLGL
jgi:hypothetical protein